MRAETMVKRIDVARRSTLMLGQRVKARREADGLTLGALAVLLELDRVQLHHVEHGRFVLPADQAQRVIDWLTS